MDRALGKRKVLVVDAAADFRSFVKKSLECTGDFDVLQCGSSQEGLRRLQSEKPQILLMDPLIESPGGSLGAHELINAPEVLDIPVIYLTSLFSPDEIKQLRLSLGSHHGQCFLPRTVTASGLVSTVRAMLDASLRRELP